MKYALVVVCAILATACNSVPGSSKEPREKPVTEAEMSISDFRRIEHPPQWEYHSVAWVDAGIVVGTASPFDPAVPIPQQPGLTDARLKVVDLAGNGFADVPVPSIPGCTKIGQTSPHRLPDGRLGYNAHCAEAGGARGITTYVYAYDFVSRRSERLLREAVPTLTERPYQVVWDDDLERGLLGGEDKLLQLTAEGVEPFRLEDIDLDFSYNVAGAPDVSHIVFAGSTDRAAGVAYRAKTHFQADVYTADRSGRNVKKLFKKAWEIGPLALSGDGRWIAAELTTDTPWAGSDDHTHVWLLDANGDARRRLLRTGTLDITWSPDRRQIALIGTELFVPPEEYASAPQLFIGDVGALLQ